MLLNLIQGGAKMLLDQNHTLFQTQDQMRKILSPLTKASGINYFSYGINYPDKTLYGLSTHPRYIKDSLEQQLPFHGFYLDKGWHKADTYQPSHQLEMAAEQGIGHSVLFIKKHQEMTEIFEFGACPENSKVNNFYLNNLNILKKFMLYFCQEAHDLIAQSSENMIKPDYDVARADYNSSMNKEDIDITKMITMTEPIGLLSKREKECFMLLIRGYSIADISQELSIAVPTIANYISRIKQKIKCHTKKDMVELARELNLVEYYTQ